MCLLLVNDLIHEQGYAFRGNLLCFAHNSLESHHFSPPLLPYISRISFTQYCSPASAQVSQEVNFFKSFQLKLCMHFLFPSLLLRVTRTPCSLIPTLSVRISAFVLLYFVLYVFLIYSFLPLLLFYSHLLPYFFVFGFLDLANRHYNRTSHQHHSLEGFGTNHKAHINKQPLHCQEGACNHSQRSVTQDSSSH